METNNQTETMPWDQPRQSPPPTFPCEQCERSFATPQARGAHRRTHKVKKSREEILAAKRAYNTKYRARIKAGIVRKRRLTPTGLRNIRLAQKLRRKRESRITTKFDSAIVHDVSKNIPHVLFCPRCGCNIRNVAMAMRFGDL